MKIQCKTLQDAQLILGNRAEKKIAGNTKLIRLGPECIGVTFHNTIIIRYNPEGTVTLDHGGWNSVTTKRRMNQFTNLRVSQNDFCWYVNEVLYMNGINYINDKGEYAYA